MDLKTDPKTPRRSPWKFGIGLLVFLLLIFAFVVVPCTGHVLTQSMRRASVARCRLKLKQLVVEKDLWAKAGNKSTNDIPTDADLFGPGKFYAEKPTCPSGGTYTLGSVGTKPRCTVAGHTL